MNCTDTLASVKPNSDGEVRINLFAGNASDFNKFDSESNSESKPNQTTMVKNGYMFKENDWRNVEITEYVKVNKIIPNYKLNGGAHFELQVRSGLHNSEKSCEGTSYHVNLYPEGTMKFEKEMKHDPDVGYAIESDDKNKTNVIPGFEGLVGKGWIGIKAVVSDTPKGVRVEGYLNFDSDKDKDLPTNNWRSVLNFTDTGSNWHVKSGLCGMAKNDTGHIIEWGGPLVIFRWDGFEDVEWKWASVREIMP